MAAQSERADSRSIARLWHTATPRHVSTIEERCENSFVLLGWALRNNSRLYRRLRALPTVFMRRFVGAEISKIQRYDGGFGRILRHVAGHSHTRLMILRRCVFRCVDDHLVAFNRRRNVGRRRVASMYLSDLILEFLKQYEAMLLILRVICSFYVVAICQLHIYVL